MRSPGLGLGGELQVGAKLPLLAWGQRGRGSLPCRQNPGEKLPASGGGRRLCLRACQPEGAVSTKQQLPRWEDVRGPRQNTADPTVTHFCAAGAGFERARI